MSTLNWHNIDIGKINFNAHNKKRIMYQDKLQFNIMVDNLTMPFGINETKLKKNIKFKIHDTKFTSFLKSIEELASKELISNFTYSPLLKVYENNHFFLATIAKNSKIAYFNSSGKEITEFEFIRRINEEEEEEEIRAFLEFRYLWNKNNCFGLTLVVTDLVIT